MSWIQKYSCIHKNHVFEKIFKNLNYVPNFQKLIRNKNKTNIKNKINAKQYTIIIIEKAGKKY